ncbi:MAG TPA: hypothetical protein EYH21_03785, partial [Methanothermococcus okinawensis]|nr:hypothetical protein [Methanothermococcus okinawensis]
MEEVYRLDDWRAMKIKHTVEIGEESLETKTLLIEFGKRRKVLSTWEGFKVVKYVANTSIPKPFWDKVHNYEEYREMVI